MNHHQPLEQPDPGATWQPTAYEDRTGFILSVFEDRPTLTTHAGTIVTSDPVLVAAWLRNSPEFLKLEQRRAAADARTAAIIDQLTK